MWAFSGHTPQRNVIPTTVKILAICSNLMQSPCETVIWSWVRLDPVQLLSNTCKASVSLASLPHSHYVLHHTRNEVGRNAFVPLFFHALIRVCTGSPTFLRTSFFTVIFPLRMRVLPQVVSSRSCGRAERGLLPSTRGFACCLCGRL